MVNKFLLGLSRHPKKFFIAIFIGFTELWACLHPVWEILELKIEKYNWVYLTAYFLTSVIIAVILVWPKKTVRFNLTNTNTRVEIIFGNIFSNPGLIVIPVNEFFDSEVGKPISPKSLHGQFIEQVLGGHKEVFDNAVNNQLNGKEIEVLNRPMGKNKKFSLGTTITIKHNKSTYFLFALSHSDNECKAHSTPALMLKAMDGLWEKIRNDGNGYDVYVPLIGNGQSGVGLPPSQLLQLMLISLLKFAKEKGLSSTVKIVLLEEIFEKIDLELIKHNWQ